MEAMRQSWSDDRIDSLDRRVAEGFRHVDQRFEQVDKRFERVEGELRAQREEFSAKFDALDERMHGFNRTLMTFCVAMFAAFAGLLGTLLTVTLTQL